MRKFISIILLTVLLINLFVMGVAADTSEAAPTTDLKVETEILTGLGVKLSNDDFGVEVTRLAFAQYLADLTGIEKTDSTARSFKDTSDPSVQKLAELGVFKGSEDGMFEPSRSIEPNEAIISIMRVLGYSNAVEAMGGGEYTYIKEANRIDLTDGVNISGRPTLGDVIKLLYNTLSIPVLDISSVSDKNGETGVAYDESDMTFIEMFRGLHIAKGQIMGNFITDLNGMSLGRGKIDIDGVVYNGDVESSINYIGQSVVFVYDADKNIKNIVSNDDVNETLVINSNQNPVFDDYTLTYWKNNDKRVKLKLPRGISVIRNGELVSDNIDDAFEMTLGKITLYKSDAVNDYDVAIIEEIKEGKITLGDTADKKLWTDIGGDYACLDYAQTSADAYQKLYMGDAESSVATVSPESAIGVIKSESGKYVISKIYTETVAGTIESVDKNGDLTYITIGSNKYQASPYLDMTDLKSGVNATFYLNDFGYVAGYGRLGIKSSGIGYLYAASVSDDAFASSVKVKIYTENKEHLTLEFAENVKIDGEKRTSEKTYDYLCNSEGLDKQLIYYGLNSEGKISSIETGKSGISLTEMTSGFESGSYLETQEIIRPKYPVAKTYTKVIVVPPEGKPDDNKYFNVIEYERRKPFSALQNITVRCYSTDTTTPFANYVVYKPDALPALVGTGIYPNFLMIKEKSTVLIGENETAVKLVGYYNNTVSTITVDEELDVSNLTEGDIIKYSMNAAGYMNNFEVLYDHSERNKTWAHGTFHNYTGIYADVLEYEPSTGGRQALLGLGYVADNPTEIIEYISVEDSNLKCMVYDTKAKGDDRFYIGSFADIVDYKSTGGAEYCNIFIERRDHAYVQFFIIK